MAVMEEASAPVAASAADASPTPRSYLAALGVHHEFAGRQGTGLVALERVDLQVAEGELMAVLGPSGCGKSTLLQILAGLMTPTGGQVLLAGRRVQAPPQDLVYLFQQYNKSLFPWRTVAANVAFAFRRKGRLARAERRERCAHYLRMVGLAGFEEHYPWQLSGGMQQRVAIARALAAEPSVLLMDEPFSAVDALTRMELQALILDIWRKSKLTIVLVTHDVDEAVFLSQRIAMLSRRPSTITRVVDTELPYPRDMVETREMPRFLELRHDLFQALLQRPGAPENGSDNG
jgi:NitT/TauT family transport system ATP-binding protein